MTCRIWNTTRINPRFEVTGEVRDANGKLRPPTPEPRLQWHPSFRFFRLGQATTDLVDAFRNYYLALESVLSTLEPMQLRPNGTPREREIDWLNRALPKVATLVDISKYAPSGVNGNPVESIKAEIYMGARTRTFHAKSGSAVFLPHDDATRRALRDSVSRLRRLYIDLAQAVLGFRFLGGGGLAPAGFRSMASALAIDAFYVSNNNLDEDAASKGQLPATFTSFEGRHSADLDDEYHVAFIGELRTNSWPSGVVRQIGATANGRLVMYCDLEGELDIDGLNCVQSVFAMAAQDPRTLDTRYLT